MIGDIFQTGNLVYKNSSIFHSTISDSESFSVQITWLPPWEKNKTEKTQLKKKTLDLFDWDYLKTSFWQMLKHFS